MSAPTDVRLELRGAVGRLYDSVEARDFPAELVIVGPAGTGKTWAILVTIHLLLRRFSGLRFLILRQTRTSLTESVLPTLEQEVFPLFGDDRLSEGPRRENRSRYLYPNGSELVLGGLDKASKILSTAWDGFFWNEVIEGQEETWQTLSTRLNRPGRARKLGLALGDTNPGDPAHWLRKRAATGQLELWDSHHRDNPRLHDLRDWTEEGVEYREKRLGRLTGTARLRLLDGLWAAGEGAWFQEFDLGSHVDDQAEFDPRYPVHLAVDVGVHCGAVWFQVRKRYDGTTWVTVFGDYYAFGVSAFDNAAAILQRTQDLCGGRFDRGTMDPAGGAQTAFNVTVAAEFERAGLRLDRWPTGPGSRLSGLTLISSFLGNDLVVHPRCQHLTEAFANYRRAQRGGQWVDVPEDPQHPYEELIDSLRGGLLDVFPEGRRPEIVLPRRPLSMVM